MFGLFLMDGGGDFGEVGRRGVVALIGGVVDGGADFGDDLVGNFGAAAAEDRGKCGKIVCLNIIVLKNYGTKLVRNSARRFKIWSTQPNFRVFIVKDYVLKILYNELQQEPVCRRRANKNQYNRTRFEPSC